ncbi:MAG: aminotransferase class III-fold pyridoxal phosphate-dependent enzyme, partial [Acidobacteriota bacterium]|nr:aminotransferase class III-fold pyridoxal phosphate-dependent enzyme [Acidobacteriota bacterium]
VYAPLAAIETHFLSMDGPVDLAAAIQESEILVPALVLLEGRVEETSRSFNRIIAAIAEPVRGEGGVAVADRRMLEELAAQSFPLILDEIQCGLGRCGSLLASEGVRGAYYLLGKSLGGGLAKISAVLIERGRYVERFDEHYQSTFAGDGFSCAVALETLRVIREENIPALAASRGESLRERIEAVQREFPDVVGGVQGRGLMLGVDLHPASATTSPLLRAAHAHEHLGLLAASYLLNRWKLRVLPTLSAPNMLRLEPSAFVDDAALGQLEAGLRALSTAIRERDLCELLGPLVEEESRLESACIPEYPKAALDGRIEAPAEGAIRIAFLNHFVVPERDLAFVEPSLGRLGPAALRALFHRFQGLMDLEPSLLFARNLFGGKVWFGSIMIPADPATLEDMHRSGRQAFAVRRIQEALDFGASLGCTVGTLGAYTSIVTDNGLQLRPPPGMKLSTGNALTVAVGASRVLRLCQRRGIDPGSPDTRLGILGATGNIGTALATRLTGGSCPFRQI